MLDLAAHLGMTATKMAREMSLREFTLWRIRYSESPFGDVRGDMRAALICSLLANINRDVQKHPDAFPLNEFMLFKPEGESDDEDEDEKDIVSPETRAWLYAVAVKADN
jgi:uncharacterized protein DUF4035